jgi:hypothetical protein
LYVLEELSWISYRVEAEATTRKGEQSSFTLHVRRTEREVVVDQLPGLYRDRRPDPTKAVDDPGELILQLAPTLLLDGPQLSLVSLPGCPPIRKVRDERRDLQCNELRL